MYIYVYIYIYVYMDIYALNRARGAEIKGWRPDAGPAPKLL